MRYDNENELIVMLFIGSIPTQFTKDVDSVNNKKNLSRGPIDRKK